MGHVSLTSAGRGKSDAGEPIAEPIQCNGRKGATVDTQSADTPAAGRVSCEVVSPGPFASPKASYTRARFRARVDLRY
jgi:hypothetical protein